MGVEAQCSLSHLKSGIRLDYSEIACTGQVAMQAPQSMHAPSSQTAFPSSMLRALTGHTSTHAPQPMQVSLSILTAMVYLLGVLCYSDSRVVLVKRNMTIVL